jgi:hypothetical protein
MCMSVYYLAQITSFKSEVLSHDDMTDLLDDVYLQWVATSKCALRFRVKGKHPSASISSKHRVAAKWIAVTRSFCL